MLSWVQANAAQHELDLSLVLRPGEEERLRPSTDALAAAAGDLLMGRITRLHGEPCLFAQWISQMLTTGQRPELNGILCTGTGVKIQLAPGVVGTASLLDIHDTWVPNALGGLRRGMFVRCCVLDGVKAAAEGSAKGRRPKRRRNEDDDEEEEDVDSAAELHVSLMASKGALVPGRSDAEKADRTEPQELALGSQVMLLTGLVWTLAGDVRVC